MPVSALHQDPANVNKHPDANLRHISDSLKTFGQVEPLVVQKGTGKVIGGNGRLQVLAGHGVTEVDVVELDIDDTKAAALGIALNRSAKSSEFDDAALAAVLATLPTELQLGAGYDDSDLRELDATLDKPLVEDEPPAPLPEPVSRRGDVWEMGGHRLMCGDSTDGGDVSLCLNGERADMVLTDPPYGVEYEGKTEHALKVTNDGAKGLPALLDGAFGLAIKNTKPGAVWYVAAPARPLHIVFADWLHKAGVWRQTITWVKDSMVLGHSDYHYQHEPIFYGWTPGAKHKEPPDRTQTTVWNIPRPKASREHPTMKPVELFARAVGNSAEIGWIIYEPFSGSGTTIIACEQLGRKCYAIEIEPRYVDVGIRRWQKLTGKAATLDGKPWADVAAERGVKVDV